ncbi:MAG: hypothetical protein MUD08_04015, partial [Cytophagales bacterium]|nr:hypothetical protein [Cytophagales bacterium]
MQDWLRRTYVSDKFRPKRQPFNNTAIQPFNNTAILIHLPLLAWLAWQWHRAERAAPLRHWFWPGLLLKCAAGVALGLLYLYHYPYRGDTWLLHDESVVLSRLAFRDPLAYLRVLFLNDTGGLALSVASQPRAFFMSKLLSLVNLFTFQNYWVAGFYCSMFSYWGLWRLANALRRLLPDTRRAAGVAFLLWPSVVFWSSGVLKETVAVGFLTGGLAALLAHPRRISTWLLAVATCWVLWQVKFYYLGVLLPAGASWAVVFWLHRRRLLAKPAALIAFQVLLFVAFFAAGTTLVRVVTGQPFLESLVTNHDATVQASALGTYVVFPDLQPAATSFLRLFPLALWSGLFAPLGWQAYGWLAFAASVENTVSLAIFSWWLLRQFRQKTPVSTPFQLTQTAAWLYVLTLA